MRKYGYNRPSATLYVRRRAARKKRPSFFFRFFIFLLLIASIGVGGFFGGRYCYTLVKNAQITDWHVKSVVISGTGEKIEQALTKKTAGLAGNSFSMSQAEDLRAEISQAYPMLKRVSVSRGIFSGKLKISAKPRQPVAQFVLPDHTRKYLDEDSTVYEDPDGPQQVAQVELIGPVPDAGPNSLVETVESVLKLKKSLPFSAIRLDAEHDTLTLVLPDQSVVRLGETKNMKKKVQRTSQIMEIARQKYQQPVILDFTFFDQGKVFLTLSSH